MDDQNRRPPSPTVTPTLDIRPATFLSTRSASTIASMTPSMLTPNTRSEAEAALFANSAIQTDAAAPTTPPVPRPAFNPVAAAREAAVRDSPAADALPSEDHGGRRQSLGLRPPVPTRSSSNYLNALGTGGSGGEGVLGGAVVDGVDGEQQLQQQRPGEAATDGIAAVKGNQGDAIVNGDAAETTGWKPKVDRQQSWSHQDMRRLMQEKLMGKAAEGDMGYDSAAENR